MLVFIGKNFFLPLKTLNCYSTYSKVGVRVYSSPSEVYSFLGVASISVLLILARLIHDHLYAVSSTFALFCTVPCNHVELTYPVLRRNQGNKNTGVIKQREEKSPLQRRMAYISYTPSVTWSPCFASESYNERKSFQASMAISLHTPHHFRSVQPFC